MSLADKIMGAAKAIPLDTNQNTSTKTTNTSFKKVMPESLGKVKSLEDTFLDLLN